MCKGLGWIPSTLEGRKEGRDGWRERLVFFLCEFYSGLVEHGRLTGTICYCILGLSCKFLGPLKKVVSIEAMVASYTLSILKNWTYTFPLILGCLSLPACAHFFLKNRIERLLVLDQNRILSRKSIVWNNSFPWWTWGSWDAWWGMALIIEQVMLQW